MPLVLAGATSGSTTIQATDAVTATLTLPSATTTLVGTTTPSFTTTIGVGAATPSASGAGITFPASQSASSNANTLDDYEEGTWTPLIQNSSGSESISLGASGGDYIKIGRMVWVNINGYATNSTAITATNQIFLRGLPFSCTTGTTNPVYVGSVMSQYPAQPVSLIDITGTQAPMFSPSTAQDWAAFTRNVWGGQTSISWRMSFCYMASA